MFVRTLSVSALVLLGACRAASDTPSHSPADPAAATTGSLRSQDAGEALANHAELDGSEVARVDDTAAPSRASGAPPPRWPPIEAPATRAPWCADGLATLDEGSCYVLPAAPTRSLLIYLHGIVPPRDESPEKSKVQSVILKAAQRAGVVALVPRGRGGFGPAGRRSWVGWPTTDALYDKYGAELVNELGAAKKKLETLLEVTFSPVYLAGSSSGAYFVARLALHGAIDVDGFGAISGGTGAETMDLARLTPKPFYIGYGKYDGYVRREIPTLIDVLSRAHWPIRVAEHPVDHGAREVYLDEAFAFWRKHGR
jgi:predicted esterase